MHIYVYAMTDFNLFIDELDGAIHAYGQAITSLVGARFPDEEIKGAFLDNNLITTLSGVAFPDTLILLSLRNNRIATLAGVTFPPTLQFLYLSNNRIVSLAGVVFPPMLIELDLSHNYLTTLDGVVFPESLRVLKLSGNNTMDLTHVKFPHLQMLRLGLNSLTHTIANNESIKKNYNQIIIHINGNKYTKHTIPNDFSQELQQLQQLQAQQAQQLQQLQQLESQQVQPHAKVDAWYASIADAPSPLSPPHDYPEMVVSNVSDEENIDHYNHFDGGKKRQSKSKNKQSKRKSKRQSKSKNKQSKNKQSKNKQSKRKSKNK